MKRNCQSLIATSQLIWAYYLIWAFGCERLSIGRHYPVQDRLNPCCSFETRLSTFHQFEIMKYHKVRTNPKFFVLNSFYRSVDYFHWIDQKSKLQLLESWIRPMCTWDPKTVRVCSPILHGSFPAQNGQPRSASSSSSGYGFEPSIRVDQRTAAAATTSSTTTTATTATKLNRVWLIEAFN